MQDLQLSLAALTLSPTPGSREIFLFSTVPAEKQHLTWGSELVTRRHTAWV